MIDVYLFVCWVLWFLLINSVDCFYLLWRCFVGFIYYCLFVVSLFAWVDWCLLLFCLCVDCCIVYCGCDFWLLGVWVWVLWMVVLSFVLIWVVFCLLCLACCLCFVSWFLVDDVILSVVVGFEFTSCLFVVTCYSLFGWLTVGCVIVLIYFFGNECVSFVCDGVGLIVCFHLVWVFVFALALWSFGFVSLFCCWGLFVWINIWWFVVNCWFVRWLFVVLWSLLFGCWFYCLPVRCLVFA